ncbi:unnamed protein product [Periconia digitata]|uniref:Major facilitator superfamily (MFS) profile domain-containing protein n=1 Tax=Periconia digitata TaxID=1303443 RepID=A0A9W4UB37_9PLEO|nr:unnamed protein product [Periconia digitata]
MANSADTKSASPPKPSYPPIPLWKLVIFQSAFTPEVLDHTYPGSGTLDDPYRVEWLPNDTRNPLIMPTWIKWMITIIQAFAFLSITFASSALSAADPQLEQRFAVSSTLVIADTSLFVLAFAIGPAIWAPLSELYGRQVVCILTYALTTLFSGAVVASTDIASVLVLRFFAGAFGASAITNSGGVVSDMFDARDRAVAMLAFIGAPFLGPSIAPIACSYLAVAAGWQWVAGLIAVFVGVAFVGVLFVPETYPPVLLRQRARKLSKLTGKVYKSKLDDGTKSPKAVIRIAMVRPWALLTRDPIVMLLSLYMAIIYGTMYMEFAAFPIVFVGSRGWTQANSGLSFVGMGIGQIIGVIISYLDNMRYKRVIDRLPAGTTVAPPEARLFPSLIGAVLLPISLFEFAWTNYPSIH